MITTEQTIEAIEKEIRETPYHKGTEHHIGKLRARISRLKDKVLESNTKKGGGGGSGYAVKKQGDATVILIGPPSAGKSTLINLLTNAQSKVAPYAFTTVSVIPGMMEYKNTRIQILDVPGLIEGAEEGKGRGREVLSVARGADLLVLITDYKRIDSFERIEKALYKNGIRANLSRPNVNIEKKIHGGLAIHSNIRQDFSFQTVKEIASELGFKNGEITLNEKLSMDRLIDSFSTNRVYVPLIKVLNKVDLLSTKELNSLDRDNLTLISAGKNISLTDFKEKIFQTLKFLIVYLIEPGQEIDFQNPIVMRQGQTLKDVAKGIGNDFYAVKKAVKIWGAGAKFPGQEVSFDAKVVEGMQIQFF